MREPTSELVGAFFPQMDRFADGFGGTMSTLDVRHAADVLGFEAAHSWRDSVGEKDLD
jgi:hypothetical protein